MTSYHKFVNSKETHELIWKDNGRNGPNMYWHIPKPKTFADIVENGSCILGDKIPPLQESIIQTKRIIQKQSQEIPECPLFLNVYLIKRTEVFKKKRSFKRTEVFKKKRSFKRTEVFKKKRSFKHINKKKKRPKINELDYNYYQKYTDGIGENEYYYRPEKIYYDIMPWDECIQDVDCDCNQCYENRLFIKLKRELGINDQQPIDFMLNNYDDAYDNDDEYEYEYEDYLYRNHDNYYEYDEYHRTYDDYDDSDN
jgi:hypothetical protein